MPSVPSYIPPRPPCVCRLALPSDTAAKAFQYAATILVSIVLVVVVVAACMPAPMTGKLGLAGGIGLAVFAVFQLIAFACMADMIATCERQRGGYQTPRVPLEPRRRMHLLVCAWLTPFVLACTFFARVLVVAASRTVVMRARLSRSEAASGGRMSCSTYDASAVVCLHRCRYLPHDLGYLFKLLRCFGLAAWLLYFSSGSKRTIL